MRLKHGSIKQEARIGVTRNEWYKTPVDFSQYLCMLPATHHDVPNHPIQEFFSRRLRSLLSDSPDGVPPWLGEIEAGNGPGLYRPNDAPWVIHAHLATLVGGIRALLMQALHPGSLAGVNSHSRYEKDPLGRLSGTIRWLTITTFGSHEAIAREAQRVNAMHAKVNGHYQSAQGRRCPYSAFDTDLLLWVHVAFMDSFLRSHQHYASAPIPGGADAYIRLWAKSVEPLGLSHAPTDEAGLLECLKRFRPELVVSDQTRRVLYWIKHPPLPKTSMPAYRLLFQAAVASMPEDYRQMLGFRTMPKSLLRPLTRGFLKTLRFAIGPDSPLEDAAIERLQRDMATPASPEVSQAV